MSEGTVYDIRTGHAIGKTRNITETFLNQIKGLVEKDEPFYVVWGRCRNADQRELITWLQDNVSFPIIFDAKMPADMVFIFAGEPSELGFAI